MLRKQKVSANGEVFFVDQDVVTIISCHSVFHVSHGSDHDVVT